MYYTNKIRWAFLVLSGVNLIYIFYERTQIYGEIQTLFKRRNKVDASSLHSSSKNENLYWRGIANNNINASHPHIGARHPDGTLGMIVDPSRDRLHFFNHSNDGGGGSSLIDCKVLCPMDDANREKATGIEGKGGNKVLQKVKRGILKSHQFTSLQEEAIVKRSDPSTIINSTSTLTVNIEQNSKIGTDNATTLIVRAKKSRILCMIYTVHLAPSYDNANLKAQASTWGRQCDGFFAASNYTDHTIGAVNLPHIGPEIYGNMWQKVRSMWAYAYDHYRNDYDFLYIGGDDIYVAVDNLRAFVDGPQVMRLENGYVDGISKRFKRRLGVSSDARPRPLVFGTPMKHRDTVFPAGGPGYMMNRAALDLLVKVGLPSFLPNATDSREDVFVGSFLCSQGVFPSDSTDAYDGQRYGGSAESSYNFKGSLTTETIQRVLGMNFPLGMDSVSDQQIAFHMKDCKQRLKGINHTISDLIYRYHAILHDMC